MLMLFVCGIILLIAAVVALIILRGTRKLIGAGALVLSILILITSFFGIVPTGYTGILRTMGRVENYTLEAGFNLIKPWQDLVLMDNREQRIQFTQQAFSSDIQQVDMTGSVVFSIDKTTAMNLYKNVGTDYVNIVVVPILNEDIKSVISKYTAEDLIGQRGILSSEILTDLRTDLADYGLNISSVSIENIDFTDAFESAVEAKQVATQTKQKAETEQAQLTMETEQAAERKRIEAQAEADVARIEAEAKQYAGECEAAMNTALAKSITPELVQYYYAQAWDGKLPSTMLGDSVIPMINTGTTAGE